jgi:hypothetical protein
MHTIYHNVWVLSTRLNDIMQQYLCSTLDITCGSVRFMHHLPGGWDTASASLGLKCCLSPTQMAWVQLYYQAPYAMATAKSS